MIVVGLDPSLTGTGVAVIDTDDVLTITCDTIGSKGHRDDKWTDRWGRITNLADTIAGAVPDGAVVAVEAPSYGQARQGGVHDRAGLWWALYGRLTETGHDIHPVPPATRARYAAGKGNAGKDAVLAAAVRRYPQAPIVDNNQADAVVLAAYLARTLGNPVEDHMPVTHLAALKGA